MFYLLKLFFFIVVIGGIAFVVWFLPKYSFIAEHPGFCTELAKNFYYCGSTADLKELFGK